jgi:hypothetical protein
MVSTTGAIALTIQCSGVGCNKSGHVKIAVGFELGQPCHQLAHRHELRAGNLHAAEKQRGSGERRGQWRTPLRGCHA